MRYFLMLLCIFAGLSNCQAGTISPNVSDVKYLDYGKKHECVVKIQGDYLTEDKDKHQIFVGSGVLIAPRVVLTAAHVIINAKNAQVHFNNRKIDVDGFIHPTKYKLYDFTNLDIAVVFLQEPIKLDFYPEIYGKQDEVNKICSISGYGMSGTHRTGAYRSDGKKRAGSNIVCGTAEGMLVCSITDKPVTSLEFMIANGDSGGGLFIDNKLAGINSCVMTTDGKLDSDYGDESCHTRLSMHKVWIEEILKKWEEIVDKKERIE